MPRRRRPLQVRRPPRRRASPRQSRGGIAMVLRVGLGVVHDGLAHQRAPGHHPPLRQEPGRQARHLIRVARQDHRDWVAGRNRGRHSPSDFTSALPISCGMPVTSAFPMQNARWPSLMPVFVHPRGKHCSWSSSSGTRRRIVKRKVSHFEAS